MNRSSFNQVLTDPNLLSQLTISDLESVVKEYPWFSLAQVLLAKSYNSTGDARSTQQMAVAATQHANRMWMHQFVREEITSSQANEIGSSTSEIETSPTVTTAPLEESTARIESKPIPETKNLAEQILLDEEEKLVSKPIETRENKAPRFEIQLESAFEKTSETLSAPLTLEPSHQEENKVEFDELDKHILATAVSSVILQEVSEEQEIQIEKDLTHPVSTIDIADESEDEFIQWLSGGSKNSTAIDDEIKSAENLIDQFITNEPKITPGKVEQYTGVHLAKDSLDDNFDWVTETMAKLYVAQGKTERARKAYKQLIKLHPEKTIYFEQQLKALNSRK
ncbi:MAG: tetratricopeptide repeat protein [Bacteroidetes bacterium]|nr:tetratricopeptide repeat protein [Bacteroidota bacterium]